MRNSLKPSVALGGGSRQFYSIIFALSYPTYVGNVGNVHRTVTVDGVTVIDDLIVPTQSGMNFDTTCEFSVESVNFSLRSHADYPTGSSSYIYNILTAGDSVKEFSFYNSNNNSRPYTDTKEITLYI